MKRVLLVLSLCVLTASADGVWGLVKNLSLPTVPTKAYQIEVKGVNARGYTFEPEGTNNKVCVLIFTAEFFQMQCMDKKDSK